MCVKPFHRSRTILDEKEDMYLDRIDQQEAVEAQFDDINDIDINSEEFRCLPEEIQHEVITNIRESRKKPFWSRFKELPKVGCKPDRCMLLELVLSHV